jgi:hypothetical protein
MAGEPPLDLDLSGLPPTAAVADIVYVPLETPCSPRRGRAASVPSTASACCSTRPSRVSRAGSA